MLGKRKCEILKEIRQRIADENEIPYKTHECSFKGECSGTCPRCESEVHYLEKQLAKRISLGKKVKIGMLCAGMALSVTGCTQIASVINPIGNDISGMIEMATEAPTPADEVYVTEGEVAWEPTEEEKQEVQGTPAPQIFEPEEFELMGDVAYFPDGEDEGL